MNSLDQHRQVRASGLKYLPDYALVEQVFPEDGVRLFPHTEQLPVIYRAVHREFFEQLPDHLVKTDHRGTDARKYELYSAAFMFCELKNALREDGLAFIPYFRKDFVPRIAIVQHATRTTPKGKWHFFGLFDEKLLPLLHLNGLPFALSTHVLDRYAERVCGKTRFSLPSFLHLIFTSNGLFMRVGDNALALMIDHREESFIALTVAPDIPQAHYFTTCLTAAQISRLEPDQHTIPVLFHFGPGLPENVRYNCDYANEHEHFIQMWKKKTLPSPLLEDRGIKDDSHISWHTIVKAMRIHHTPLRPGTRLAFQGNMHSTYFNLMDAAKTPLPIEEKTLTIREKMEKKMAEEKAAAQPSTPPPAETAQIPA